MNETINRSTDAVELNIGQILALLLRRWWLIALSAVFFAGAAYGVSSCLITPRYEASALFYANNDAFSTDNRLSGSDLEVSKSLVDTYIVILNTRQTLNAVIDRAAVDLTVEEVSEMISAQAVEETELFRVVVEADDPAVAGRLANAIAQVLPSRISAVMDGTYTSVADSGTTPVEPSSPRVGSNTITGFLFGFVFACSLILLKALFDVTIRREADIFRACDYPVLASVPEMGGRKKDSRVGPAASAEAAEAYKLLRTKLQYAFTEEWNCRVIGVSSALAGEGKSTSAINLAYTLAQLDRRVLLIDCDMRRPTVYEKLPLTRGPGLGAYLSRVVELEDVVKSCQLQDVCFHVIAAGRVPPNPGELLGSRRMAATIEALRKAYDDIVLDLPPVGEVGDAVTAARYTDGMLLVVRRNFCDRWKLAAAIRQFESVDARILGIVMNRAEKQRSVKRGK